MGLSKERIAKDKILKEGFDYRRFAWMLFPVCAVLTILVRLNLTWLDVLILALNLLGFSYVIKFKLWTKRNKAYIESLGFDAK